MKRTYSPGDNVQAGLRVTDPRGAVSAAIGIGVSDAAVDERAGAEEEFGQPSWGWGAWYEENQEIGGLTLDDLNSSVAPGGSVKPLGGPGVILGNSKAVVVKSAEQFLRLDIASNRQFPLGRYPLSKLRLSLSRLGRI